MTPKQFQKYLNRDSACLHCGKSEAVAPNHRANRGMGGSKSRDVPSNIIVLCSWMNGAIESDHRQSALAKRYGWKLESWQDPLKSPVYDTLTKQWKLLDNNFGVTVIENVGEGDQVEY